MSLGMCTKLAASDARPMINFYMILLYENVQYDQFFITYRIKVMKEIK